MWKSIAWRMMCRAVLFLHTLFLLLTIGLGCLMTEIVAFAEEGGAMPRFFIDGQEITSIDHEGILSVIENKLDQQSERKLTVLAGDKTFETKLSTFHPQLKRQRELLVDDLLLKFKELESIEWATQLREPIQYDLSLDYKYDQQLIEEWVRLIEKEVYIEKIEPTFDMQGYNQLVLNEGRDGQLILAEELRDSIIETLEKATGDSIEVKANLLTDPREHDVLELRKINAKISSYSTTYLPGIPRAKNVELAASKVSQTILMPGEQFSYAKKVSPVSIENGYVNSTVFFNGRPVPGVGGGICQVSSTLYNAHLLAGITATERRNHSLPVSYVPLGQDATMVDYSVDLKFINTLDYPIYIYAYAAYGSLTVELWSNADALHGIRYEPKTVVYDHGLKADTTLYGYNAEGEVVYEKFLHTSVYKKKSK